MSRFPTTRDGLLAAATKGSDGDGLLVRKGVVPDVIELVNDRTVRFVISTQAVDRDNDTINPKGWDLSAYQKNPVVLWAHDYTTLPVGRSTTVEMRDGKLVSECEFADHEFADTVYRLVKGGFLKATSVGFQPKAFTFNEKRGGFDFSEQELMEYSIVPVPSNPEALIDMKGAKAAGIDVEPMLRWAKAIIAPAVPPPTGSIGREMDMVPKLGRWNPSLGKAFDVDGEPADPARLEYKWASRFLDVPVKDLYETTLHIPSARMGNVLTALDETLARFRTLAIRNLDTHGEEHPPEFETIQLNSTQSRSFLVAGTRFLDGPFKWVGKMTPSWSGVQLTAFSARGAAESLVDLLSDVLTRSRQYKFLKGEAMTLGGQFLARGTASWDELFLDPKTMTAIQRTAQLLNEQGSAMDSRGVILMGPPGTGKTLAARALMSEATDATFIWCSARDFYYTGAFGGMELAYDLARENAPSVVLFEDIDSFMDSYAVDLLKVELDGLQQHKGIVTVLTTNFPQRLPDALIDRPGRFHDVLNLSLPDEAVRRRMLGAWAAEADSATLDALAQQTDGMSGAHLRELVRFANTIRSQDAIPVSDALAQALAKVVEQREVIDAVHDTPAVPRRRAALGAVKTAAIFPAMRSIDRKGGVGICDRCSSEGALAVSVCAKCREELHAWSHDAEQARTAQMLDEVKAGDSAAQVPVTAEVTLDVQFKTNEPQTACRICEQELVLTMPRIRDDLGVVCAPCFVHATHATKTLAAPPVSVDPPVEADIVIDFDALPREDVGVELDESNNDVLLDLNPDDIRAALRSAVTSVVGTLVRDETRAALNRARGRVD
jgi:HK97 family phage prohead protease